MQGLPVEIWPLAALSSPRPPPLYAPLSGRQHSLGAPSLTQNTPIHDSTDSAGLPGALGVNKSSQFQFSVVAPPKEGPARVQYWYGYGNRSWPTRTQRIWRTLLPTCWDIPRRACQATKLFWNGRVTWRTSALRFCCSEGDGPGWVSSAHRATPARASPQDTHAFWAPGPPGWPTRRQYVSGETDAAAESSSLQQSGVVPECRCQRWRGTAPSNSSHWAGQMSSLNHSSHRWVSRNSF